MWETGKQKVKITDNVNESIAKLEGYLSEKDARKHLVRFLKANVGFTTKMISGKNLFPFQEIAIKTMLKRDYVLGVWCDSQDSILYTDKGLKKIIDVEVGDMVFSKKQPNKVLAKKINEKAPGKIVRTQSGWELKAKNGHRVLSYSTKYGELEYKYIDELTKEDYLVIRKGANYWGDCNPLEEFEFEKTSLKPWGQKICIPKHEPDFYKIIGLYLGDGWFNLNDKVFSIASQDSETIEFLERKFLEYAPNNKLSIKKEGDKFKEVYHCSKMFCELMIHMGFDPSTKARDKKISDKLLGLSEENSCALLSGLFSADGFCSIRPDKRYKNGTSYKLGLKSTSKVMLNQVRMILLNLGIFSNLHETTGKSLNRRSWNLMISGSENVNVFKDKVGFLIDYKQKNLEKLCEKLDKTGKSYQTNMVPKFRGVLQDYGINPKDFDINSSNISLTKLEGIDFKNSDISGIISDLKDLRIVKIKEISDCECVTVDITVENEECYIGNGFISHNSRGMSKTWSTAIFAFLQAIFSPGSKIAIISRSFRQSRMIFKTIEEIAAKPEGYLLAQCFNSSPKHMNDEWAMQLGSSEIKALPLGTGDKLRGFRFNCLIIDELLLMPEQILNEVILPFLGTNADPDKRQAVFDKETALIEKGLMTEEERTQFPNPKMIGLSSASYEFEYLYTMYKEYKDNILNGHTKDGGELSGSYAILQLAYECAPTELYSKSLIEKAKNEMSKAQFKREFGAQFTGDSSGFFNPKAMEACTVKYGEYPQIELVGSPDSEYILAIDPSWAESESSDYFVIEVFKVLPNNRYIQVHSYAVAGGKLKDHIRYFFYILTHFNIAFIAMDNAGGITFLNACNESKLFKDNKINLKEIKEVDFENTNDYQGELKKAKQKYNKEEGRIVLMQVFGNEWIRRANEMLQGNIDNKRIWWASDATDENFDKLKKIDIGIEHLKYIGDQEEDDKNQLLGDLLNELDKGLSTSRKKEARQIELIERQAFLIKLTKTQISLIDVKTTDSGKLTFTLPQNLKNQKGPNKTRRDLYTGCLIGTWAVKCYNDMKGLKIEKKKGFIPTVIK